MSQASPAGTGAPLPLHVQFVAGDEGYWLIERIVPVAGAAVPAATRLAIYESSTLKTATLDTATLDTATLETATLELATLEAAAEGGAVWQLRGVTSQARYTTAAEAAALRAVQPQLGRAEATRAALIPIRKSPAWWALAQDERRALFAQDAWHTSKALRFLPAIARRLHHSRELAQPFDFLTWFEFAPEHESAFDELLAELRASPEWAYVEREVEIRLSR